MIYKNIQKLNEAYLLAALELDSAHAARISNPSEASEEKYAEAYKRLNDIRSEIHASMREKEDTYPKDYD